MERMSLDSTNIPRINLIYSKTKTFFHNCLPTLNIQIRTRNLDEIKTGRCIINIPHRCHGQPATHILQARSLFATNRANSRSSYTQFDGTLGISKIYRIAFQWNCTFGWENTHNPSKMQHGNLLQEVILMHENTLPQNCCRHKFKDA
jgi:hypothetical protein